MEPAPAPPETTPAPPAAAPAEPVMDVVAPPPPESAPAEPAKPTDSPDDKQPPAPEPLAQPPGQLANQKPAAAKKPSSGHGLAILATVVIVIVLAGLATFAYMQSK